MKDEYVIIDIRDGNHSKHGGILIVKANPINTTSLGFRSHCTHLCSETDTFFFPKTHQIIEKILSIAQGGGIWTPNKEEYSIERINEENTGRIVNVYLHATIFTPNVQYSINSGKQISLIQDATYKARELHNQYYNKGWYSIYTFPEYVESLAEGEDVQGFWSWLFGVSQFDGLMPFNLPEDFYLEYQRFLEICKQMEY